MSPLAGLGRSQGSFHSHGLRRGLKDVAAAAASGGGELEAAGGRARGPDSGVRAKGKHTDPKTGSLRCSLLWIAGRGRRDSGFDFLDSVAHAGFPLLG